MRKALGGVVGAALPAATGAFLGPRDAGASVGDAKKRWGFVVDTEKCTGCGFCVTACKTENEIPWDAPITRTWVERYVVTKDGETHIDSPLGGRDGFIDDKIRGESIDPDDIAKAFLVPKLCNQCDNPPCVQVCPVGATYQTNDGVVLVDNKWCIGCGYCIMACPYGVRFFNPVTKVADKCNFCYHRISQGMEAACVQACPFEARLMGDLNDPEDPVAKIVATQRVGVLKDEYGTKPQVFYLGLDVKVR
jgi:Fe-S-cluster-containing dehydrogenase component